jgi:hypothetical protein
VFSLHTGGAFRQGCSTAADTVRHRKSVPSRPMEKDAATTDGATEHAVDLEDFQQGFLAGWLHAQGWNGSPSFEQFNAAALAWESWMETQNSTRQ